MALFLLALALSMDAFAAAVCQGARNPLASTWGQACRIGLAFGTAQAVMPLLGWGLGMAFVSIIHEIDHWVAFILLSLIGGAMIRESLSKQDEEQGEQSMNVRGTGLILLSLATSIDAAVAGITLPLLDYPVVLACILIGVITLTASATGVFIGRAVGVLIGKHAEMLGGIILIAIGLKTLLQHFFFEG